MIYILDNFLEESFFNYLKNFSKSNYVRYSPRYFDNTTEKTIQNTYGIRHNLSEDDEIIINIKNKCLEKFKYNIIKISECGLDKRNLILFKPHTDEKLGIMNFYLQVEGETNLNRGIGFYTNDNNLDIHVGFKENRAVLFKSNIVHTPLVDEKVWRTTLTCFIKDGYFV
jgi:hypothetical protein